MYQETLTAYKCKFKFRHRDNPKYEEQKELIRNNEMPIFTVQDFLEKYVKTTSGFAVGKNADRAIKILKEDVISRGDKRWYIKVRAGKQGRPFVTVDNKNGNVKEFDNNTAALYEHNVFIYEKDGYFIAIFHRRNGSGCKSVFLETANDILRKEGLILDMQMVVSPCDEFEGGIATRIKLMQVKEDVSSDAADNIRNNRSKTIIREIGINLEEIENYSILNIFHRFQNAELTKDEAFLLIKEATAGTDIDGYNDGEVMLKVQGRNRKVNWSQLESIIGEHDITLSLENTIRDSERYVQIIGEQSDKYCVEIERLCDEVDD